MELTDSNTQSDIEIKKEKRKEYMRQYNKKYYQKHKLEINKTSRQYYQDNKEYLTRRVCCPICYTDVSAPNLKQHNKDKLACVFLDFLIQKQPEHEAIERIREICKSGDHNPDHYSYNESKT